MYVFLYVYTYTHTCYIYIYRLYIVGMYIYIYITLYIYIYTHLSLSINLSISLSLSIYIYIYRTHAATSQSLLSRVYAVHLRHAVSRPGGGIIIIIFIILILIIILNLILIVVIHVHINIHDISSFCIINANVIIITIIMLNVYYYEKPRARVRRSGEAAELRGSHLSNTTCLAHGTSPDPAPMSFPERLMAWKQTKQNGTSHPLWHLLTLLQQFSYSKIPETSIESLDEYLTSVGGPWRG